ncbi:MAG: leucine-rich repeat protein [Ruminococcus sp.]|nr:leucine-rich repeat protein [Ruminococcus sp.]
MKFSFGKKLTASVLSAMLLATSLPLTAFAAQSEFDIPITYDLCGGVIQNGDDGKPRDIPQVLPFSRQDETLKVPNPVKAGSKFDYWKGIHNEIHHDEIEDGCSLIPIYYSDYEDAAEITSESTEFYFEWDYYHESNLADGITLFPEFDRGETVTLYGRGGTIRGMDSYIIETPLDDDDNVEYGDLTKEDWGFELRDYTPVREGYTFLGWCTKSDALYDSLVPAEGVDDYSLWAEQSAEWVDGTNHNLYAKWVEESDEELETNGWRFDPESGELAIKTESGMGKWKDSFYDSEDYDEDEELPAEKRYSFDQIKKIRVEEPVDEIPYGAFRSLRKLTEASIAASVTYIRENAFANCQALEKVSFDDFSGELDGGRLTLLPGVFTNCKALSEIRFPKQLGYLGEVFDSCKSLKNVYFAEAALSEDYMERHTYKDFLRVSDKTFHYLGTDFRIHVPESLEETFKTDIMPQYAEIINSDVTIYPVSVNGGTFTGERLKINCGEGFARFDPETNTLTLHDADITDSNSEVFYCDYNESSGISTTLKKLTIVLEGTSRLSGERVYAHWDNDTYVPEKPPCSKICAERSLVIKGSGTLDLTEAYYPGIEAEKNLTIDGAKILFPEFSTESDNSGKIESRGTALNITDSEITGNWSLNAYSITDSVISGSRLVIGGGIYSSGDSLTLINCDTELNFVGDTEYVSQSKIGLNETDGRFIIDGGTFRAYPFSGADPNPNNKEKPNTTIVNDSSRVELHNAMITEGGWTDGFTLKIGQQDFITDENTGVQLGNTGGIGFKLTEVSGWNKNEAEQLLSKNGWDSDSFYVGYKIDFIPEGSKPEGPVTIRIPVNTKAARMFRYKVYSEGDNWTGYSIQKADSWYDDGYVCVSTNTPDCYFVTIIPERIEPYDIVIDKLEPQPDDAKVTVSYFSNTQSVEPGSDGSYRTQVSNEHNVTVTVSATGYRTKTFYMSHGYVGVWELGTVELEPLPVSGLVRANITVNGKDTLRSFDGLNPTLTLNGSEKIDMRDCELSFPYIILKQAVLDKLYLDSKLTLTLDPDHDLRLTGGSVDIDLETASCAIDISKMGYAEISLGIQNKNNTVIIFDSLGRLVENGSASTLYTTERMNKGAYTAVAFEKNPYIFSAVSLDSFRSAGLEEGTDYAIAAFTVDNNKKTSLALSVPKFTKEPGNGFLDRGGCSVRALGSDFRINQGFLLKIDYAFSDNDFGGSKLKIDFPHDAVINYISAEDTLFITDDVYDKDSRTALVPVSRRKGTAYVSLSYGQTGLRTVSVSAKNGGVFVPLGAAVIRCESALTLTVPSTVSDGGIKVTVKSKPQTIVMLSLDGGEVQTIETNAAGSGYAVLPLPEDAVTGTTLTVSADDGESTATATASYFPSSKTEINELSFQIGNSETVNYLITNGVRNTSSFYSFAPWSTDEWWTIEAKLIGVQNAMNTDDVGLLIKLSDGSFKMTDMSLAGTRDLDGDLCEYRYKALYMQEDYSNAIPVNFTVLYGDKSFPEFKGDESRDIDYAKLFGIDYLNTRLNEKNAQLEEDIKEFSVENKINGLVESFKNSDSYKELDSEQKEQYEEAVEDFEASDAAPDTNWLFNEDYKFSKQQGFEKLTADERGALLGFEESMQEAINIISSRMMLRKPLNEYSGLDEVYGEFGISYTENYTGAPTSDFTRVDKSSWLKDDKTARKYTVINTAKKLLVEIEYGRILDRQNEVVQKINEALKPEPQADNGKTQSPVGDGPGDITTETAIKHLREAQQNRGDSDDGNAFDGYLDTVYEYLAGESMEAANELGKDFIKDFTKFLGENYEAMSAAEIKAGGDGTKSLIVSMKGAEYAVKMEKFGKYVDNVGLGITVIGYLMSTYSMYQNSKEIVDIENDMNTMEQIDRMVWNSDLDIADKLAWQEAHTDYVSSLLECKSIAEQENLYEFSLMAAGTTSFIPKIGKPASVMVTEVMEIGLGPTHIRNSYQRPTLETKRDLAEKRMIRILQKLQEQGGGNTPDPTKPTDATEPTGITNPTDSTNPTSSTAPTDSTSPTQGTEPAEDPDELTDAEKEMEDWYYKNLEKKSKKDGTDTVPVRDPSGIVYEAVEDNVLSGVTATIWYSPNADGSGAVIWNAANFDQINPQITTSENGYLWLVPDGYWQVRFEKDGYEPAQTEWMEVPPPRMGLTTPMISTAVPKLAAAAAYPDYVELIFNQYMDTTAPLTAEGYTPAWANASASPDGKQLSRVLRLAYSVPKKAGDQVAVTTAGGKNYAGREYDGYTGELTVVERPVSLTVDQSAVETYVGGSSKVTVQVLGTDGKPLSGVKLTASAGEPVRLDSTSGTTDSEGKAVFNVTGAEVGVAVLAIVADNTTLKQEVQIVVHADASGISSPILLGDVNGDGKIDIMDATTVQKFAAELIDLDADHKAAADVTGDGKVDIMDATMIQKYVAELIDHFG